MRIGLLLYEGVDLLDAGGPYEVFLTASRLVARDGGGPPFEVVTITGTGEPVTAYGGLGLVPQAGAEGAGHLDVLVLPGTVDVAAATADDELASTIVRLVDSSDVTASVCTGAFLLADAGLLAGRPWTTHWEDVDLLADRLVARAPAAPGPQGAPEAHEAPGAPEPTTGAAGPAPPDGAVRGVRWVDAGRVVTAAGLSSGIAMALHLVDRFAGRDLAERTARQIEYDWRPDGVHWLTPAPNAR